MKIFGTHFVGQISFKIAILGTVKFVVNVEIGENGIAITATNVLMALAFHAIIAASQGHMQTHAKTRGFPHTRGRTRQRSGQPGLGIYQFFK
jgi:hypothetical protein